MKPIAAYVALALWLVPHTVFAQATKNTPKTPLADMVTRMARIGRSGSPSLSPDGKRLAFVSDRTGTPQVWVTPLEGGAPVQVTNGADPVSRVIWSPDGAWLSLSFAPGGGMNTQIAIVRPDGTGLRRLTDGGRETNNLGGWTHDGRRLTMGSNRASPSSIDAYVVDPISGDRQLVSGGKGVQTLDDVSRDGTRALVARLRGRGDNDLYLVDLQSHAEIARHAVTIRPGRSAASSRQTGGRFISRRTRIATSRRSRASRSRAATVPVRRRSWLARDDAELGGFAIDDRGTTAALLWNVAGRNELAFVDLASGKQTAGPKLPGEIVGGLTFSKDGRQLAMTIGGATAPSDIWVLDVAARRLRQITQTPHEGVDLATLVRPQLVTFKAHDGLELSGWLYRPAGAAAPGAVRRQLPRRARRAGAARLPQRLPGARRAGHRRVRAERARIVRLRQTLRESR